MKEGTALTDAVTGSKSLTTHAASKRFKLRCTVVTQECAVSRFRVTTFSRSYVPIYPHVPEVFSQFKCGARLNYVPYSMKGELRFFGVSSLSHSFARALPYSAMERRNRDFFNWFSSNHHENLLIKRFFLVGSRPTLGEYF